jgi:hypothetical protein
MRDSNRAARRMGAAGNIEKEHCNRLGVEAGTEWVALGGVVTARENPQSQARDGRRSTRCAWRFSVGPDERGCAVYTRETRLHV